MQFVIPLILLVIFSAFIAMHPFFKCRGKAFYFIGAFWLKVVFSFALLFIYSTVYTDRSTADVFKYYDDASVLYDNFNDNPVAYVQMLSGINDDGVLHQSVYKDSCSYWVKAFDYRLYNDNRTIIRFNALLYPFTGGNIYSHSVIMAFLSFLGGCFLLFFFYKAVKINTIVLFFSVFCIPSLLMWTSGLLKEGLLMFGLGLFLYYLQQISRGISVKNFLLVGFAIMLLALTKYYILLVLFPSAVAYFISVRGKKIIKVYVLTYVLAIAFLLLNYYVFHFFPFFQTIASKQNDFIKMSEALGNVGSLMQTQFLEGTPMGFIKALPNALYVAFFRPTFFDIHTVLAILPAVENFLFLLMFLSMIVFFDKRKIVSNEILLSIFFVFSLYALSGLTTPVIGALVRYKAPALPLLAIIIFYYTDFSKMTLIKLMVERVRSFNNRL